MPIRTPSVPALLLVALFLAACSDTPTSGSTSPILFQNNPCGSSGTVQLASAQTTLIDCSGGGTTVTFAGAGASYLIVAQFAGEQGTLQPASYSMASGTLAGASASLRRGGGPVLPSDMAAFRSAGLPAPRPLASQRAFDGSLRGAARRQVVTTSGRAALIQPMAAPTAAAIVAPPALGSLRSFRVRSNFDPNNPVWTSAGTRLAFVGTNLLVYVDTLAPAAGFTPTQLQAFSQYSDQTLYAIDATAFGQPSDVDQNGRVIMVMSPLVNGIIPAAQCATDGFIAGFFDEVDFQNGSNPNSNQGEIFYTIVPDPSGVFSCAHSVDEVGASVPATFLHELQHLIDFSQHVVVHGGAPGASWLDEGLSIAAEELGAVQFEQRCPPPACRQDPAQLFPDSAQGFVQGFLIDSYLYALLPDTASITLSSDDMLGSSWRGGAWLLTRWLGDQFGSSVYSRLEQGPSDGLADLTAATGQSFQTLFANFGMALYTDSLPGLPRSTAPAPNRFVSRNLRQLWGRLFVLAGGDPSIPLAFPVQLFPVTADTSTAIMVPGTMTYFRLDTPSTAASVTIRFSAPGGSPLASTLQPQLSVFRLPAGQ
jgi:hypothetical protein